MIGRFEDCWDVCGIFCSFVLVERLIRGGKEIIDCLIILVVGKFKGNWDWFVIM